MPVDQNPPGARVDVWQCDAQGISQFFLPDALSEFLYTSLPAYRRSALRNVLNSSDGIALRAGDTVIGAVREAPDRYIASLALVVDPQAEPKVHRSGPGSGPPPGFGGTPALKAPEGAARAAALVPAARQGARDLVVAGRARCG